MGFGRVRRRRHASDFGKIKNYMRMIMTIYPTNLEISEGILQLIGHEALLSTAMIGVLSSVCEIRSEPRQERCWKTHIR